MKRTVLAMMAAALIALPAAAPRAQACANADNVDYCETCLSTPVEECDGSTTEVVVQLGGIGSVNNDGVSPGQLDDGTKATALVTITKVDADTIDVEIRNTTCTTATITGLFLNTTETVTGLTLASITPAPLLTTWMACYDQTAGANDGHGFKAGGFGNFDGVITNSQKDGTCDPSANGGDPHEILAGDALTFRVDIAGSWSLCDFMTELSQPQPPELLRTMAARFQSGEQGGSGRIAPCVPGTPLLANYRFFEALPSNSRVVLDWATSLEVDNAGFNVFRRSLPRGTWEQVNREFIFGRGDSVTGAEYSFEDGGALNGVQYIYRLEDIDFDGINNLSRRATAVANPRRSPIRLASPSYGAQVRLERGLKLGFDSTLRGGFVVEISPAPVFPESSTVSARLPVRGGASEVTLSPRTVRMVKRLGGDGSLYWRIVNRRGTPVSDTFRMEVK